MKRAFKWTGLAMLGLLLAGALLAAHTWYFKPLRIDWLYTRAFAQFAFENPELLTELRLLEPLGLRGHNARLADATEQHQARVYARLKRDYAQLLAYDRDRYTGQERLSYDIFEDFLGRAVRGERWRLHDYPVNPLAGVQIELPNLMIQSQQVRDATDAEHYIARLGEFPRRLDEVIDGLKLRESRAIVPPKFVVEKVLVQIARFGAPGASGNELSVAFRTKLEKIPAGELDAAARAALQARVEEAVAQKVLPAYARLAAHLESLRPRAQRNDGVWALPDGEAFYRYQIEQHTTTTLTADALHRLGLEEVARVGAQIDGLLAQVGHTAGTRGERLRALASEAEQRYPDNDEGRAQVLRDYQQNIDAINAGLAKAFSARPRAAVRVARAPLFMEATTPAAWYEAPALDDSRPGTFFVNLGNLRATARYRMRTLAHHEAVPGHHLQTAIAQELQGLPVFRRVVPFTAYGEGWALYAEQLAGEMGYLPQPRDQIGQLDAEMLRSMRLVVDTGLHAKRWTREQAIEFMRANSGEEETTVVNEVERYLVAPGQALAYKVGMMRILALREKAKAALGAAFDIREFHDAVLRNGALPLTLLEREVDAFIARKR